MARTKEEKRVYGRNYYAKRMLSEDYREARHRWGREDYKANRERRILRIWQSSGRL